MMASSLMASTSPTESRNLWALDTGWTQHLSQDFINIRAYSGGAIQGISGSTIQPQGVGTVKLGCTILERRVIMLSSDTLFCPDAVINLISVSQLMPKRGVNIPFTPLLSKSKSPAVPFWPILTEGFTFSTSGQINRWTT